MLSPHLLPLPYSLHAPPPPRTCSWEFLSYSAGSSFPRGYLLTDGVHAPFGVTYFYSHRGVVPSQPQQARWAGLDYLVLFVVVTCLDFRPVWCVATETLYAVQRRPCSNQLLKDDESLLRHPTLRLSLCGEESAHSSNEEIMLLRMGWVIVTGAPGASRESSLWEWGGGDMDRTFYEGSAAHQDTKMMCPCVFLHPN